MTYRAAPMETLERVSVPDADRPAVLGGLGSEPSVDEVVLVSTCNRVEIYTGTRSRIEAARAMVSWFASRAREPAAALRRSVRVRNDEEAVRHLFRTVSGLDSMAIGEDQVVAQVRHAFQQAREAQTTGPELARLMDEALRTSKRVRTETDIGAAGRSLVHIGLDLGREALAGLADRTVLLIGSGAVSRLAGRLLREQQVGQVYVASRTHANATRLAQAIGGGVAVATAELSSVLARCDIVVASTAAPEVIVSVDQLAGARAATGNRPLFLLDLAVPRDIDPRCRTVPGAILADLTDIGQHANRAGVPQDLERAEAIVLDEAARFLTQQREATVRPLIAALRTRVREDVETELAGLYRRVPDLDERQRAATSAAMHRIVGRLLHTPTVQAKELSTAREGHVYVEAFSRLFGIDTKGIGTKGVDTKGVDTRGVDG